MSHAERCPVCNGSGVVTDPPPAPSTSVIDYTRVCHGCGGRGWVEVADQEIK